MSTTLILRELTMTIVIGIDPPERHTPQQILIDAEITLTPAAATPAATTPTYDYHAAVRRLRALGHSKHWDLIETLAEATAATLLEDRAAATVTVYVRKPHPLDDLKEAGARLTRPAR